MPEEDSHLSDQTPSQAHLPPLPRLVAQATLVTSLAVNRQSH
jgi:hypothetical protein